MFKRYSGILIVILALSHFGHGVKESYALPNDQQKAAQYHAEGLRLFNQGEYAEAAETWKKEFALDNKNANTAANIGIAYERLQNWDESFKYHSKALELNPNFGKSHNGLGLVYYEKRDYEKALEEFKKGLDTRYNPGLSHFNVGLAQAQLDKNSEAKGNFLQAIKFVYKPDASKEWIKDINIRLGKSKNTDIELKDSVSNVFSIFNNKAVLNILPMIALFIISLILVPLVLLLYYQRRKTDFFKPNTYKVVMLIVFLLIFPSPILLPFVLFGLMPAVLSLVYTLYGSSMLGVTSATIIGYVLSIGHYLLVVFLNYSIVCFIYKHFSKPVFRWGVVLLLILLSFSNIYFVIGQDGRTIENVWKLYIETIGPFIQRNFIWYS